MALKGMFNNKKNNEIENLKQEVNTNKGLRDKILDIKSKKGILDVSKWGCKVEIRELSAKVKYDIVKRSTNIKTKAVDTSRMVVEFIIASAYDPETGEKIFEATDYDAVSNLPAGGVDQVFNKIASINKLEDVDDTVKN